MHDPLLDTNVRERTWYDIAEELQDKIAWVARKGRSNEAFKCLNVLDLIDAEASAYWREYGMDLYAGLPTRATPVRRVLTGLRQEPGVLVPAPRGDDGEEISLI